jgi:hypothetical protein
MKMKFFKNEVNQIIPMQEATMHNTLTSVFTLLLPSRVDLVDDVLITDGDYHKPSSKAIIRKFMIGKHAIIIAYGTAYWIQVKGIKDITDTKASIIVDCAGEIEDQMVLTYIRNYIDNQQGMKNITMEAKEL